MQNDFFGYMLLSGPLCGILMVLGGILLLYKGAITLSGASEDALSVEFKKELRISTQYPALGIFIIGLLFVAIPAILGRPPSVQPIIIKGNTNDMSEPVSIKLIAASWSTSLKHKGSIVESHRPFVDTIQIEVTAPGHDPYSHSVQLSSLGNRTIELGDIKLVQRLKEGDLEKKIATIPNHITLPGKDAKPAFGGSK